MGGPSSPYNRTAGPAALPYLIHGLRLWMLAVYVLGAASVVWAANPAPDARPPGDAFAAVAAGDMQALERFCTEDRGVLERRQTQTGYSLVHWAVKVRNGAALEYLLQQGASPDVMLTGVGTPVEMAAKTDSVDMLKALLARKCNLNSGYGLPRLLQSLINYNRIDAFAVLVDGHVDLVTDGFGTDLLLYCIQQGRSQFADVLLRCGVAINAANTNGLTPLCVAASLPTDEMVRYVLAKGGDVHTKSGERVEATWYALSPVVVRSLAASGADLEGRDTDGETLAHRAVALANGPLLATLLDVGAPADLPNAAGMTPLACAVDLGSLELVRTLVAHGAALAWRDAKGRSLIHLAGTPDVARELLAGGADPQVADADGWLPLHAAASRGNQRVVGYFLDELRQPVDLPDAQGRTPLMAWSAWYAGPLTATRDYLVGRGASIQKTDNRGRSVLHWAATNPRASAAGIAWCVKQGAKVRQADVDGMTPLHLACGAPSLPAAQQLVDLGADIDCRNAHGATALMSAAEVGALDVVRMLVARGADIRITDDGGRTSLHVAGNGDVVGVLVERGSSVTARDHNGLRPIHVAADADRADVVRALVACGAEVDARTAENATPLHRAAARGAAEMALVLLSCDAMVNARDRDRRTPLHCAIMAGKAQVVSVLLGAGANPNARTGAGESCMDIAQRIGTPAIADALLMAGAGR